MRSAELAFTISNSRVHAKVVSKKACGERYDRTGLRGYVIAKEAKEAKKAIIMTPIKEAKCGVRGSM